MNTPITPVGGIQIQNRFRLFLIYMEPTKNVSPSMHFVIVYILPVRFTGSPSKDLDRYTYVYFASWG